MRVSHLATLSLLLTMGTAAGAQTDPAAPADKKICKTHAVTGSLVRKKRICMTQSQWDEQNKRAREATDRIFDNANTTVRPIRRDQYGMEPTYGAVPGGPAF